MSDALQVKGFAWLNLLHYVREQWGDDTLKELARAFPADAAQFDPAHVLPIGWIPGALHIGALEWLVKHRHEGTLANAQTVGRGLAERNLAGTFRSLTRLEDLKLALTSTERAFSQFYSLGKMKLTLTGDVLDAQLTEFPNPTPIFGNVLGAGMVAFLRAGHIDAKLNTVTVGPSSIAYQVKVALPAETKTGA
ncbi:MAG: hypothetical protein Q8L48_13995 [Archangium sp.]|nr:hypothetical protein [Archangium sp.]